MAKKKAFLLRIQPDLWDDVSRWAADELRSVNGHIEYLLRRAVAEHRGERSGAGSRGGSGRAGKRRQDDAG